MNGCSRDAVLPGDLSDGAAATAVAEDALAIEIERRPSDVDSLEARPAHAAADQMAAEVLIHPWSIPRR